MNHRFTISSATRAAQQEIWVDFGEQAKELFGTLSTEEWERLRQGSIPERVGGEMSRSILPTRLTVLDYDGRIVATTHPFVAKAPSGAIVPWLAAEGAPPPTGRVAYGFAEFPDGVHTAVRYEVPDSSGFALLHVDGASIERHVHHLLSASPAINTLTVAWTCALLGVAAWMLLGRLHDEVDQRRSRSATSTLRQTHDLLRTRDAVIFGLAKLADSRDPETGDHLERISIYSTTLAAALRRHPRYRKEVTPAFVRLIGISSALHDIGKVGVADHILLKPGKLTSAEFATMQTHAAIGGNCLQEIERRLGGSNFLQMAREIAFAHHENWNGTGYPRGLAKTQIPLAARIVAIADVYDALSSKRVYKDAIAHSECVAIIRGDAGKKFDPDIVEAWLSIESTFRLIAQQHANRQATVDQNVASRGVETIGASLAAETLCVAVPRDCGLGV